LILSRRRGTGTPLIDRDDKNMWRIAGTTGAVGIEIVLAIGIGYFGGNYLDRKFGTAPWLMYLGLFAGIGAAIKGLMRVTRYYRRNFGDETKPPSDADASDKKD
jgi:F0F1-type ATP synthase assembly protein I